MARRQIIHAPEAIGASAFRAFHHANADGVTWELADDQQQALFERLGERGEELIESMGEAPVADKVELLWRQTRRWLGQAGTPISEQPAKVRLVWEALLRHLFYLFDADDHDDLLEMERSWGPWVEKRLKGTS